MQIRARGTVRVMLNNVDISEAMKKYRPKKTPKDSVVMHAMDYIKDMAGMVSFVSCRMELPDSAIVTFRLV